VTAPAAITKIRLQEAELDRAWARVRELQNELALAHIHNRAIEDQLLLLADRRRWQA
jgi:hypothetical protein